MTDKPTSFTPGPWHRRWHHHENGQVTYQIVQARKPGEIEFNPIVEEVYRQKDANLIAASPDLYAALAEMLDWHESYYALPSGNFEDPDQHKLVQDARQALLKARGE